ncbi:MAG: site-2 protease family protein [Pseudomonadota bacterium]
MTPANVEPDAPPLPDLRDDLELLEGAPTPAGGRTCLIYDPLRHKYFVLGASEAELLAHWQAVPRDQFLHATSARLGRPLEDETLSALVFFLHANHLVVRDEAPCPQHGDHGTTALAAQTQSMTRSPWQHLVHSYLFFRIPLVRPHKFLVATRFLARPFFSPLLWLLVVLSGVGGLYLASRQWETFKATFLDFLSLEGVALFALTAVLIKVLHELGHAWTAERYGVRVTTMGIAFMVMMPLAYTDVTDAWRLTDRGQRLRIAAAGIAVELALACVATLAWVFLPDGPMRSAAFLTATTSWILTLAVNLNPFMKFDGYYLLSDGLGLANLQARAFALGRWQVRELLFGLGHPRPDTLSDSLAWRITLYAWCVWIYRLVLFLGIALLVYHLFFKLLGVTLFIIEIVWFIALPICKEVRQWWVLRREIMDARRVFVTGAVVAAGLAVCVVPIGWTLTLPAVVEAERAIAIHPPREGRIAEWSIAEGRRVRVGDVLAVLDVPDLRHRRAQTRHALTLLDLRLARIAGDVRELAERTTLERERIARQEELDGLERQLDELVLRAPHDGVVRDASAVLHVGAWVGSQALLGRVVAAVPASDTDMSTAEIAGVAAREDQSDPHGGPLVRAYVNEDSLVRVSAGAQGAFVPDDPGRQVRAVIVRHVAQAGVRSLEIPYLASVHGGAIPSERDPDDRIRPRRAQHVVTFQIKEQGDQNALSVAMRDQPVVRGVVRLDGVPEPLYRSVWRRVMQVLVRESGI